MPRYLPKVVAAKNVGPTYVALLAAIAFALLSSACATPPRQMAPLVSSLSKFSLSAAIICTEDLMRHEWKPPIWSQGFVSRAVHTGRVLCQTTLEAMSLVFDNVSMANSEATARSRGAQVQIWPNFDWEVVVPTGALRVIIVIDAKTLDNALTTVAETGTYYNPLTAVDDGYVRNAALDAFKRITPRLLGDHRLRAYAADATEEPIATMAEAQSLRTAAAQGDAGAQASLGDLYRSGRGVLQDAVEAAEWYHKAAGQGHVQAQYILGTMYVDGEGVVQDYAEAAKWYRKAAEQGLDEARKALEDLIARGLIAR